MPIEYDRTPGATNKKQRKRDGTIPVPAEPVPVEPDIRPTLRVRFLRPLSCRRGVYAEGQVVELPRELARSWASFGFVEEDKMLPGAPEVKDGIIAVAPGGRG